MSKSFGIVRVVYRRCFGRDEFRDVRYLVELFYKGLKYRLGGWIRRFW